ncbi:MFS transporter [Salmonella enterica subsp. enterica serovar Enteritidis]|uniref:MFS transporter n=4 Tax=Salmonella enterica TaxID=28901 RepID=A0A5Z2Y483_SALEN|nr:MFS transporter [Salmonella enterica subsp. enterica serovar Enteritidis]ECN4513185.1 MFS transporter [Salmonella enterica subsp. enterica serovar Enteritidis]ECN6333287.1 MFS transporter [Salmonella enterica subsp. enterica serovar Enteritidis]ECN7823857.1 MFS transporter [Salmonella enterica subsp. enterica serovar Enteritidis]ECR6446688.1 MFS transporter [Salmonella enterica subsp. enterica serovar Enteritidis]
MNTNVYENTDSETITPLNKRRILPVFLLVGLYAASTAAVMSVLPFYIREMGGSPLIIGIIIATEAFSQFCAAPLIGHLSDRVGRKRILIVTLAIAAISLLLLANAQCILFILLARTLFGISAGNLSAAAAYIADCTHVRNRRQAIGILTGCIGLGGIVGAGVSGWLSRISLSAPIYAAFILVLGSALVAIWGLKDPSTTSRTTDKIAAFSARAILKMPVLRVLIIVMLCHFFAYGMYSSQLPVFLSDTFIWNGLPFGPKALSYLLMADGVINIFVQLFLLGWVSQYFSERKLIILIFALLCTGFLTAGSAIRNTLDLASFAGRISFTGWPKQETSLPTNLITYKELDLRGSRTSAGEFDEALRMLSTLEINPQDVVSKVVNLDEIPDAVKELDRYPERYLKINAVFH